MTRDEEREAVLGAERPGSPRRPLPAGERRELAVADDLAPRDVPERSASASWNGVAQSPSSGTSANETRSPLK